MVGRYNTGRRTIGLNLGRAGRGGAMASGHRWSSAVLVAGSLGLLMFRAPAPAAAQAGNRRVDIVSVSGCLREQPAATWLLTTATDPVKSSANAPEKKELPASQIAGKNQFQLIGVGEFNLPALKDQYVIVKGLHIVASPMSRLNVTSVTPVFPTCANPQGK